MDLRKTSRDSKTSLSTYHYYGRQFLIATTSMVASLFIIKLAVALLTNKKICQFKIALYIPA